MILIEGIMNKRKLNQGKNCFQNPGADVIISREVVRR